MGEFLKPAKMKAFAMVPLINQLDDDVLDVNFIQPAEKAIEDACCLDLNTDGEPWHWYGTFATRPDLRTQYLSDYERAVIYAVNRRATNPHGYGDQTMTGASATFGTRIPVESRDAMRRWGRPRRLFRT